MPKDPRLFGEFARAAGGAAQALSGIRNEVEALVRGQLNRLLSEMDLVTRDEFEAVKAMAAKARAEQEALEKRLAALEAESDGDKA